MQNGFMNEGGDVYVDGDIIKELQFLDGRSYEKAVNQFATSDGFLVEISQGVTAMPQLPGRFAVVRGSKTPQLFKSWMDNNEVHDVEVVRKDAHGVEYGRTLFEDCQLIRLTEPAINKLTPEKSEQEFTLAPQNKQDL